MYFPSTTLFALEGGIGAGIFGLLALAEAWWRQADFTSPWLYLPAAAVFPFGIVFGFIHDLAIRLARTQELKDLVKRASSGAWVFVFPALSAAVVLLVKGEVAFGLFIVIVSAGPYAVILAYQKGRIDSATRRC